MPAFDDYSEEDQNGGGPSQGNSMPAGGGGAVQANPSPQRESTFTPWSRFVSANEDVSNREAGKLQSNVQSDVNAATSARDAAASQQEAGVRSNYQNQGPTSTGATGEAHNATPQAEPGAFAQTSSFNAPQGLSATQPQAQPRRATKVTQPKPTQSALPPPAPPPPPATSRAGVAARPQSFARDLSYNAGLINPNELTTDFSGAPRTSANLQGSKSLEAQLGPDAWAKLTGQTNKAQNEATALGSETGVQGLIQSQAGQPLAQNGAFDAALETGAGGKVFQDISRQYGNGKLTNALGAANQAAIDRWQKLTGDASKAAASRQQQVSDLVAQANRPNAQAQPAAAAPAAPNDQHFVPVAGAVNQGIPTGGASWQGNFNTQTNPDGEQVWPDNTTSDQRANAMDAQFSYGQAKGSEKVATLWVDSFGVKQDDADWVLNHMSADDWASYQQAAQRGPTAVKQWFDGILAKRK